MADFLIILKHFEHLISNIIIIYLMILVIYKVVSSLKIKQLKTIKLSHVYIHLIVLVYVVQKYLLVMAAISSFLELVTSYSFKSI
jgi:hypothetical protein